MLTNRCSQEKEPDRRPSEIDEDFFVLVGEGTLVTCDPLGTAANRRVVGD
jgi:sortase (surface protein transpeptidase)